MSKPQMITVDGNEACASVAYRCNEIAVIYPITPSSTMGELADQWAAEGRRNLWGAVPEITEMQSEGGAAGAVHGAIQAGALGTTFTASQGLLLMIPNMYKIAGELTPFVMHVSARTLATHALSIFGDHSDVMATRQTGFAMLASASVQEAQDMAAIAQAATLRSRVPFLHFFDGFRTSHEVAKIAWLDDDTLARLIDEADVHAMRARALSPDHPVVRGTAQNPDTFFQAQEARNPFHDATAAIVGKEMERFAALTGRVYHPVDYVGAADAEEVIVVMGSGAETADITSCWLNRRGGKTGVIKIRLYRPFPTEALLAALPKTVRSIAVLDRCKEPGSIGEPLYLDVIAALDEGRSAGWVADDFRPRVTGGRYGLASKEFTPAMVKAIYDDLRGTTPKRHFTVGINDDVTGLSLPVDEHFRLANDGEQCAVFFGLGADGTVGANKNSIKIIAGQTDLYAQGYFVYDSKKSGAVTISHLRFSPEPIKASYLVEEAQFVACHHFVFLDRYDVLRYAAPGATLLLNAPWPADTLWHHLPGSVQQEIIAKQLKVYTIDARAVAQATGMGARINTIMQTCFFALSGVLPRDEAIEQIKYTIKKTYGKKGEEVVKKNIAAVDQTLANLFEVKVPAQVTSSKELPTPFTADAPKEIAATLGVIYGNCGESLPVSAFSPDGTFPTGTSRYEKRNLALEIPVWDEKTCIQCAKCAVICPHACIRIKPYEAQHLQGAPATFKSTDARSPEWKGLKWTLQVAPEDCTGCCLCVEVCPAKNKTEAKLKAINMRPQPPIRLSERENYNFFLNLPEFDRRKLKVTQLRQAQVMQPLFEYSGACAGCGETPYLKLLTQLFGDRIVAGNATGCSSIYSGNLPTTPYAKNKEGRGPTWNNSLFEDNAEFGLGFRVSIDKQKEFGCELLRRLAPKLGDSFVTEIINASQTDESGIYDQRERVAALKQKLAGDNSSEAKMLLAIADNLVRRSVWIIGGDGWAYDIGYGGLDHVLASGRDVNVLVLDTEVYSNTGGQCSKSTPRGAVAKFAAGGKPLRKKDLGLIAMGYGSVYVASVAMGAKDEHTLKAFLEAESYPGPSLIIAYSHCIAHGIDLDRGAGAKQQRMAVDCGQWLLYRHDPRRADKGENPLQLDSTAAKTKVHDYLLSENRFKMLTKSKPEDAKKFFAEAQVDADRRFANYQYLAGRELKSGNGAGAQPKPAATVDQQP